MILRKIGVVLLELQTVRLDEGKAVRLMALFLAAARDL
jgi:hypothetical protein